MLRFASIVVAVGALVALAAVPAWPATGRVVAHGKLLKGAKGKIELLQWHAVKPRSLTARVTVSPKQSVKIDYSVVCVKGTKTNDVGYNTTATPKTGTSHIVAPGSLPLPMAFPKPSSCDIAVYSTLSKGGKQTLVLVQS